MPVSAAIFDLDDTLIASDRARMRKLRDLLGPGADLRRARAIAQECWDAYQRGESSWDEQRRRRWTAIGCVASSPTTNSILNSMPSCVGS